MRSVIKKTALAVLRSAGVFSLGARSKWRADRLTILCYHGLSLRDEHQWAGYLYITPAQFRQRLQVLKSWNANVLPLTEAIERLRANALPPRSVAITFDDGFYDFRKHAFPILNEFGYPSTVYLTTHYCRYRLPIFNLVVNYLLWKGADEEFDLAPFGRNRRMPIDTDSDRQTVIKELLAISDERRLDTLGKDELARQVAEVANVDYSSILRDRILQILAPEEVSELARAGVDIQLHTHRHRTPTERTLFRQEIRDNATSIREFTGTEPVHFCYPSGYYALEFLPWLEECGVKTATTSELRLANAGSHPLLLPRLLDHAGVASVEFESWITGVHL